MSPASLPDLENWLLSLPATQERRLLGVVLVDGQPQKPQQGQPGTHVLRPDLGLWRGAAFTEVFCQSLARRAGLPAIETSLWQGHALKASLAPRYDVQQGTRLKSETFARRLGPQAGLAACFALLEETAEDVRAEQQVLMDMVLFNALIGNSLADASLFALIHETGGTRIAPLHGALCAGAFPHLPQHLALPIGEAREPGQLRAHDWELLASTTQLEPAALATRALDLAQKTRGESRGLAMSFEAAETRHLVGIILAAIEQNTMTVVQSLKGFLGQKAA